MLLSRRSLLRGLVAAPAVIAVGRLMPVKLWGPPKPPVIFPPPLELWGSYGSKEAVFLGVAEAAPARDSAIDMIVRNVKQNVLIDRVEFRRDGKWLVRHNLDMPQAMALGFDFKSTITFC